MKGSEFIMIDFFNYKLHKVGLNRGGPYLDFPEWLINKKATINPITKKDDKCFQYAVTVSLNEFEKNNKTIALNALFVPIILNK